MSNSSDSNGGAFENSWRLLAGRRFLVLNLIGYAALFAVNAIHVPWTSQGEEAKRLLFARETTYPIVAAQMIVMVYLFALYFLALLNWEKLQFSVRQVLVIAGATAFVAWCSVPGVNSADPWAYLEFGRLAGVHGMNPYLHAYPEVHDAYSPYAWFPLPMPYGPVVLLGLIPAAWVSKVNVLLAVYFMKLEWLAAYAGSIWLLLRTLQRTSADPAYGVFLFALNPLLLLELIVTGHNDGLVILFALLSLFFLQRERGALALWSALLCALVKLSGILLLVGIAVLLLRKRDWKSLSRGSAAVAVTALALKLTLLPTAAAWRNLSNPSSVINFNSLHGWLLFELTPRIQSLYLNRQLSGPRLIVAGLFALFCLWRLLRIRDFGSLVTETANMTIALIILYSGQFFAWYLTWLLPYAALTNSKRLRQGVLLYTFTALGLYAIPILWVEMNLQLRIARWALVHIPPLARLLIPERAAAGSATPAPSSV
jgi:alpha-1,6-mannosyltransferase